MVGPVGEQERSGQATRADVPDRDVRRDERSRDRRCDRRAVDHGDRGRVVVEADAPHDDGVAPDDGRVDAVVGRQLLEARVRPPPHRGARGVVDRVGGEDDDVGADVGHVADVEVVGGHGRATHHEPSSIVLVRADDHAPVRQPRGRPRRALDPRLVAVGPQRLGRTGRDVGAAHLDAALVPGMQGEERPVVVPRGLRQVGEVVAIPAQLGPRAVEPKDPGRDLGVRGARGGVGDLRGLLVGMRRIRDPPALDGRVVDPRREEGRAVRRPPEPAEPVHLLGGRELGHPPAHLRVGFLDEHASGLGVVQLDQPQAAPVGPCHPGAGGVGPGVDDCARDRDDRGRAGDEVCDHQLPGERRRHHDVGGVRGIARDARRALPGPLPPHPFLRGQVGRVAGEQRGGIRHHRLRHPRRRP